MNNWSQGKGRDFRGPCSGHQIYGPISMTCSTACLVQAVEVLKVLNSSFAQAAGARLVVVCWGRRARLGLRGG
eukprot:4574654-Pyramimonas_sp.AAC.1